MNISYSELIEKFSDHARNVPRVYDILLRGSTSVKKSAADFVENWSDLDFSIIVNKINSKVREAVRDIYHELKKSTDMKITITLVDKKDFFSKYHSHGARPIYYSCMLHNAKSLLRGDTNYAIKNCICDIFTKSNCFANITYLIHDLRKEYILCSNDLVEIGLFCRHLVKRAKHLIRNAIFIKTDYINENISNELLVKHFEFVDHDIPAKLKDIRSNWNKIRIDYEKLQKIIDYVFNNLEKIYDDIVQYCQQI